MDPELAALQQSIQLLHQLMTVLSDPNATNVVAKCVQALTGLQKEMMAGQQQQGGGMQQAVAQRLQGGQQGGY